jgi:hypothetical protein
LLMLEIAGIAGARSHGGRAVNRHRPSLRVGDRPLADLVE